jgi:predicted amidohydrolase YtcJ
VRAVKLYADGALGSRGAALLEPYSDDPKNTGSS